jgi:hypothetical protein
VEILATGPITAEEPGSQDDAAPHPINADFHKGSPGTAMLLELPAQNGKPNTPAATVCVLKSMAIGLPKRG